MQRNEKISLAMEWHQNHHLIRIELRLVAGRTMKTTFNNSQTPSEIPYQKPLHCSFSILSLSLIALWNSPNPKEKMGRKNRSFTRSANRAYMNASQKRPLSLSFSLIKFIPSSLLTSFHDRRRTVTTHSQPLDPHRITRQSTSTCQTRQTKPLLPC